MKYYFRAFLKVLLVAVCLMLAATFILAALLLGEHYLGNDGAAIAAFALFMLAVMGIGTYVEGSKLKQSAQWRRDHP